jgi:hypothetical protein
MLILSAYLTVHGHQTGMFVTASFLPGVAFSIAFMLNTIALSYGSLNYIPLGTLVRSLCL